MALVHWEQQLQNPHYRIDLGDLDHLLSHIDELLFDWDVANDTDKMAMLGTMQRWKRLVNQLRNQIEEQGETDLFLINHAPLDHVKNLLSQARSRISDRVNLFQVNQ